MRRCLANDNISLIVCYEHAPFSGVRCFSPTLLRWFLRGPGIAVGGTAYSTPMQWCLAVPLSPSEPVSHHLHGGRACMPPKLGTVFSSIRSCTRPNDLARAFIRALR